MSRTSTSDMAARLRHTARQHPIVASLKGDLPALDDETPADEGLYLETAEVPGMVVNGELRVSVARLFSIGPDGTRKMVGQVQAIRATDHPLETWELRFFVHVHKFYATHEVEDESQWFIRVLEQHYRNGGDQVAIEAPVEA